MEIMTVPETQRFAVGTEFQRDVSGVTGIALPFNADVKRPGIAVDDGGNLAFFDVRVFDPHAFDWEIERLNEGDLPMMWSHGLEGDAPIITGIPIGHVTQVRIVATHILFSASFNETNVAEQVKQVVGDKTIRDVSAMTQTLQFRIEQRSDGLTVQRITRATLLHISLVVHAEFMETKLTEVFCSGCGSARFERQTESTNGHAGRERNARSEDTVETLRVTVGELHAQINDLEHESQIASTLH